MAFFYFFCTKFGFLYPVMEMGKKKKYKFFNSKLTSAVSVSMVLFLLGCILTVALVARSLSDTVLEKVALTIYMKDNVPMEDVQSLTNFLNAQSYTKEANFISKEQAMKEVCEEIGEDPENFSAYNPMPNTFVVYVKAQYANNDSISAVASRLTDLDCVQKVDYQRNMISTIERNVKKIAVALSCATLLLLVISYVLIHNTIQLLVHSDRFLIHTMKLVGATGSFIRRPYLKQSLVIALVAFLLVVVYILAANYFLKEDLPFSLIQMDDPSVAVPIFGVLLLCSIVITSVATIFAVNKYLSQKLDDLYYM